MARIELDKVMSLSGTGAQSDQIPLPAKMIKGFELQSEYTVTDAGISPGENFAGYIDTIELIGDGEVKFAVKTDELTNVIALLAGGKMGVPGSLYTDADPTTAEAQRAHFYFPFPHDLTQYQNAYLRIVTRAATAEWGGASALTGSIRIVLDTGLIRDSIILERIPKSSATQHDFIVGTYPAIAVLISGPSANTATRFEVVGSDDVQDVKLSQHQQMAARYHSLLGAAASDDTDTTIAVDGFLCQPKGNGNAQIFLTLSSAAAVVCYLVKVAGMSSMTGTARMGDISRGVAKTKVTQYKNKAIASALAR